VSNGLFASDGVDVAQLIADNLGPRVLPCVLYKAGAPGVRDPANPTKAPVPAAPSEHKCRGFIEDFSSYEIDGTLIKAGDKKVTLLTNTIQGKVVPDDGDRDTVLVEGTRHSIHRILSRDPAAATYLLQVRSLGGR
jgi:hypothetical protein